MYLKQNQGDRIMDMAPVNLLAVIIMAFVYMGLACVWYSKSLFGTMRMEACNIPGKEKEKCECTCTPGKFIAGLIVAFIIGFVLAHIVRMSNAQTAMEGIRVGFWMWLGFVGTTQYGCVSLDRKANESISH